MDLEQRLAFLDWTEADARALGALRPLLEKHADRLVAVFYRQLLSFEDTRKLLMEPEVKDRLLDLQRRYLLSLAGPTLDGTYVEERLAIGRTHERIGLAPRWYLGAYAQYFGLLAPLICAEYAHDRARAEAAVAALVKLLSLDAQLAMEAYIARREEHLAFLNRELAATGRSLARDLEEQSHDLRATRERAQAAEELASVATLAAGLAHEIGTPMGVIRGHAELLQTSVADERGRWRLQTIVDQIDRISRIIQALLNLARPHPSRRQPLAVSDVVDATLSFLTEKFRRAGVTVERAYAAVPPVLGDAEKLQQVLLNLYLNAVDAMPDGGRLRVAVGTTPEGAVRIRVADTGTGIATETLPSIFDAFYTTKEAGVGTGLGLMVARSIVRDHGGELGVESGPGGSEFWIELPAHTPEEPDAA